MNRLRSALAILLLLNGMGGAYAQQLCLPQTMTPGLYQSGTTPQQVTSQMNTPVFATDTVEGGFASRMNFFQQFWQGRAIANDSTASAATGVNMFSQYYNALRVAMSEREAASCGSSGFHGDWSALGPDSLTYQATGKVDAVWASPADSNYVLAGTVGGLFKTANGGATWACITDNAPVASGGRAPGGK